MNSRSVRYFAVTFWIVGHAIAATAQSTPRLKEALSVTVVEIPVTVIDRNGSPVRGLTAANFEIVDEGRQVPIAYFEAIDHAKISDQKQAEDPLSASARRIFMLLFDMSYSSPGTIDRAREAAQKFVRNALQPKDLVAVSTFSVDHGFQLLTSFTTNRELVESAVSTLGNPKYFKVADPLYLSATAPALSPASGTGVGESREAVALEIAQDFDRLNRQLNDEFRRGRLKSQLESFGHFARILDSVRGRKQVILLTEGFDAGLVQGKEQTSAESRAEGDTVASGEVWKVDFDQRYGFASSRGEIDRMADLFRRSDVILHAIDIKGLRSAVDAREGYKKSSNESLYLLSKPTGGEVFKNANDIGANFQKMMHQQEVVYVLGFSARPSGTPGRFHNLKVKLVGVPGSPRIAHRAGYYEPSAATLNALEQTLSIADILLSDIPQTEIPFSLLSSPFPVVDEDPLVPVILEIPGDALLEQITGNRLDADLYVYAFDRSSAVRDYLYQKISLDLSKVRTSLMKSGLKYYGSLRLEPGEYSVKALIRIGQNGRTGFQHTGITVPHFDQPLALSPFVWEDEGKWIMVKGTPRSQAELRYPFHVAEESFVPSASRTLVAGRAHKISIFTYNMPAQGLSISGVVQSGSGSRHSAKLSLVGATDVEHDATKLVLLFDPAGLAAGSYSLTLRISHKDKQIDQTMVVPFAVVPAG